MDIENIVEELTEKYGKVNDERSKQNPDRDAAYWLHLGQANEIGDLIVFLIEKHQKENTLSDYLIKTLEIFKTS